MATPRRGTYSLFTDHHPVGHTARRNCLFTSRLLSESSEDSCDPLPQLISFIVIFIKQVERFMRDAG
jgi:hypothetical protein